MFGDGCEERMAAFFLENRLRRDPEVQRRNADYLTRVKAARVEAFAIGEEEIIRRLMAHNPAYIRHLLETENARHGAGALQERYARTFCKSR